MVLYKKKNPDFPKTEDMIEYFSIRIILNNLNEHGFEFDFIKEIKNSLLKFLLKDYSSPNLQSLTQSF